jgi:hypothetical protein
MSYARTANYDAPVGDALDERFMATWVLRLAAALEKGRRKDIRVLDDRSADLVLNFPGGLGPLLALLAELDTLKAMASVATVPSDRGVAQ